jgi:tRNA nucleotidyltransferase (CCA-adding enzyme)
MPCVTHSIDISLPADLRGILCGTPGLERAYVVGGGVRDALIGRDCKDFDVEVFGHGFDSLGRLLAPFGKLDLVGKSFGVIKLTTRPGQTYDFSLPRRDSKVGTGHKGFQTTFDPSLDLAEATARRDFTVNALLFDPRQRQIIDCHGGLVDLEKRILRHTSRAFVEDPLRVLRGMQFISRFDFSPAPETIELCRQIAPSCAELAPERIREEWFKWAGRSTRPSAGLRFLSDTGWIEHFPEVAQLRGVPQDPEWHPEGDVFVHTGHCCDAMVRLPEWQQADEASRVTWMLAILAHDFGKPSTTRQELRQGKMRIVSPEHEAAGGPLAQTFLERLKAPNDIVARVLPLVINHLAHLQASTDRAVRRLANRLQPETIEGLCVVMAADCLGRPPRPAVLPPTLVELRAKAGQLCLQHQAPKGVLLGRHLLALGMSPGREMGAILNAAFEAQLEGEFQDHPGALRWLKTQAEIPLPPELRSRLDYD